MDIYELLGRFPKQRPVLDAEMASIYEQEYRRNRNGETSAASMAQKLEAWMHHRVASANSSKNSRTTLELGAGTLNQIPFETTAGDYDIVEPMSLLYEGNDHLSQIRECYSDISEVPVSNRYDRIISVAVLEHLENLPKVISDSIHVLKEGGVFACGIPSEGGFLWGLAWRMTTGLEYRLRTGFDYGKMMRHEHVNEAWEIEQILRHFFHSVRIERFGLGRHLSLYTHVECRDPVRPS